MERLFVQATLAYHYLGFFGNEGQTKGKMWITDIERTFEVSGYTESQKVLQVSYLLQGEAALWWGAKRQLLTMEGVVEKISWERFIKGW